MNVKSDKNIPKLKFEVNFRHFFYFKIQMFGLKL